MSETPYRPIDSRGPESDRPNRAYQRRRDNDTFKTPKVTIYDIDFAIMSWLEKIGKQAVNDNGNMVDCVVQYANGERWAQIQANGFMRDTTGKIITPVMALKRTTMERDPRIDHLHTQKNSGGKLILLPKRSRTDMFDRFSKTQNAKKVFEYYATAIPEFVVVTYELIVWTDYVEQLNHLVQDILPTSGYAWGDTWKFVTEVQGYDFITDISDGQERIVRCDMTLQTQGILLDDFELDESTVQKAFSTKRVVWDNEKSSFDVRVDQEPPGGYDNDVNTEAQLTSYFQRLLNGK